MLRAGMSSTDSIISARYSRSSGRTGANVTPQLPMTTDVTPCQHDELSSGSQPICASRCVCRSTNPGVTSRSVASISRAPRSSTSPTATMRSPLIPTSATDAGPAGAVDHRAVADDEIERPSRASRARGASCARRSPTTTRSAADPGARPATRSPRTRACTRCAGSSRRRRPSRSRPRRRPRRGCRAPTAGR